MAHSAQSRGLGSMSVLMPDMSKWAQSMDGNDRFTT